jgi:hypothetical protein
VTTPLLQFVPAELVVMGILTDITYNGAPANVVQSTSISLSPGTVRVRRVPGEPRTRFDDPAHVEVMAFGATFEDAQALAEACWETIEFAYATAAPLPGGRSVTVDYTETKLSPTLVPWPNPDVRVFQATYLVVTRAIPV